MRILLSALLTFAFVSPSLSDDLKSSEQAAAHAKERRALADLESKRLGDHPWAGTYYYGDGLGVNVSLTLAPDAGFVFEWHGCMGVYDRNWGVVSASGDRLRLLPELPNRRQGFQGIPEELVPVAWGARHYLIASDEVLAFCNSVNDGGEPREGSHGPYLLREGDQSRKVSGRPVLPAEYRHCFLDKPIAARVIAVAPSVLKPSLGDSPFRHTTVTLDVGRSAGVWEGMRFRLTRPKGRYESATVQSVGEHSSEALIVESDRHRTPPAVGWRLTAGPQR